MKVAILHDGANGHRPERMGWARCLQYCGHEVSFIDIKSKSPYDLYDEFPFQLLFAQGFNLSESLISVLHENPDIRVWLKLGDAGPISTTYNLEKHQILVASDDEIEKVKKLTSKMNNKVFGGSHYWINRRFDTHGYWIKYGVEPLHITQACDVFVDTNGKETEEYKCDMGMVSGYWPYKAKIVDTWLLPLMNPLENFNIKVFGYNWPTSFYCGTIEDENEKHFLKSCSIGINLHEPHAMYYPGLDGYGLEINARTFKLLGNKVFCVSDRPNDLADQIFNEEEIAFAKTPLEFRSLITHFLSHKHEMEPFRDRGYKKILKSETHFHRMAYVMANIFGDIEEKKILEGYEKAKKELSL